MPASITVSLEWGLIVPTVRGCSEHARGNDSARLAERLVLSESSRNTNYSRLRALGGRGREEEHGCLFNGEGCGGGVHRRRQGKVESLVLVQRGSVSHSVSFPGQAHNPNPSVLVKVSSVVGFSFTPGTHSFLCWEIGTCQKSLQKA